MSYFGEYEKFRYMMEQREKAEKDCENNMARASNESFEKGESQAFYLTFIRKSVVKQ